MARNLIREILAKKPGLKEDGLRVTLSRIKNREDLKSIEQAACYYIKKNGIKVNVSSVMDAVTRDAVDKLKIKSSVQRNISLAQGSLLKRAPSRERRQPKSSRHVSLDIRFVRNDDLRFMLQRDIVELNIAISAGVSKTQKTCMVMAGSIAETMLLEQLMQDATQAISVAREIKIKYPLDLEKWDLGDMVKIATQMNPPLLPNDLIALADQTREWRNLIHPGRELRDARNKKIEVSPGRANAAISVLQIIEEHLSKWNKGNDKANQH